MLPGQNSYRLPRQETHSELVIRLPNAALLGVLSHTGLTLDDVVNCPVAKNRVFGYFKLNRFIIRRGEIMELEKQWNPLGVH